VLLAGLAANLAATGIDALVTLRYPSLLDPDSEVIGPEEILALLSVLLGIMVALPLYVSCIVLFCLFVRRANRNARALGARNMEFTPGWAVGWFFVPFANLFKPYQAVREIYLASDPTPDEDESGMFSSGWWSRTVPIQLNLWWGTWILMNIVDNTATRLSFRDDAGARAAAAWLGMGGAALSIPCTLLVIWLIFEIQDRQAARNARRMETPGALLQPR
jgi:hypothetical protein